MSRCIPRDYVMDRKEDCYDGADEKQPIKCNTKLEYKCKSSGRCLLRHMVNDNFQDCDDGSDENVDGFVCLYNEFDCEDGRCIPFWWVRNNIRDCQSGSDEIERSIECLSGIACLDKSRCIPLRYVCDGSLNCVDGSDEIELCDTPTFLRLTYHPVMANVPIAFHYLIYFGLLSISNDKRLLHPYPEE